MTISAPAEWRAGCGCSARAPPLSKAGVAAVKRYVERRRRVVRDGVPYICHKAEGGGRCDRDQGAQEGGREGDAGLSRGLGSCVSGWRGCALAGIAGSLSPCTGCAQLARGLRQSRSSNGLRRAARSGSEQVSCHRSWGELRRAGRGSRAAPCMSLRRRVAAGKERVVQAFGLDEVTCRAGGGRSGAGRAQGPGCGPSRARRPAPERRSCRTNGKMAAWVCRPNFQAASEPPAPPPRRSLSIEVEVKGCREQRSC